MQQENVDDPEITAPPDRGAAAPGRGRGWKLALFALMGLFLLIVAVGWFSREQIADNLISAELERLGIPAQYTIESIGPQRQIISDVILGEPDRPDFTAKRVAVDIALRFGAPAVTRLSLVEPRIYGTFRRGKLSLGSLDPLIFTDSDKPFALPDLELEVVDGRGHIDSDYGPAGLKLAGRGGLRGGFAGELAAAAPLVAAGDCTANGATLYGKIGVDAAKPFFSGPLRVGRLTCTDIDLNMAGAAIQAELAIDEAIDGLEGDLSFTSKAIALGNNNLSRAGGSTRFTWRDRALTARYDLAASGATTPQVRLAKLGLSGSIRAIDNFKRLEVEGDVKGTLHGPGAPLLASVSAFGAAAQGTLAGDLISQIRQNLLRETRGGALAGRFILRRTGDGTSLVVPTASLRGKSGSTLASLSRLQVSMAGAAPRFVSGNFSTGGAGLPQVSGRLSPGGAGRLALHLRMREYRAKSARLEMPQLVVERSSGGGVRFAGKAMLSGAIPGGALENMAIPIEGNWSDNSGLSLWSRCAALRFDGFVLADLRLRHRQVSVCPPRGGAIVRSTPGGLKIAGGIPALDLSGNLGQSPIRIASGPLGFAWPGNIEARSIDVALGPAGSISHFRISGLSARLGSAVSGQFEDAEIMLDAVPLDLRDVSGKWRFAEGRIEVSDGSLRMEDREQVKRFQPMIARDARLSMAGNVIQADALFREPQSDREVLRAHIGHDLSSGAGQADLFIDALRFDKDLQPDTLTHLALGVIANAQGIIRGEGRIDWDDETLASSGRFSTDDFDFAAAFGPVSGVSGTVRFTDLLGLVTAPDQKLAIGAINPGIEVTNGLLTFSLKPDYILDVAGARWPFLGGSLQLEPAVMQIGSDDPMRYALRIDGLDAALFLQHLDIGNLAATGKFDGRIPLVFGKDGGQIENGFLNSRGPGGNVSYVGELTYEDLTPIANFAFDALRSVDYRQMRIGLSGSLEGEIVTRVSFDGISQGDGASSNFLTRRIAKLPISFRVNVRAPFMQLTTSVRSFYDPEYIRDPRTLGLSDDMLTGGGTPLSDPSMIPESGAVRPDISSIQPSESEEMP